MSCVLVSSKIFFQEGRGVNLKGGDVLDRNLTFGCIYASKCRAAKLLEHSNYVITEEACLGSGASALDRHVTSLRALLM